MLPEAKLNSLLHKDSGQSWYVICMVHCTFNSSRYLEARYKCFFIQFICAESISASYSVSAILRASLMAA